MSRYESRCTRRGWAADGQGPAAVADAADVLMALENRSLLSTILVNNPTDTPVRWARPTCAEAIALANGELGRRGDCP